MKYIQNLLRLIKNHKALPRLDEPTTQIIFLDDFGDTLYREYYEESSKHFKTFGTVGQFCHDHRPAVGKSNKGSVRLLDIFGGKVLEAQIISKNWTKEHMADHISFFLKSIGLTEFSNLIVVISPSDKKDYSSLARYLCQIANDIEVKKILNQKFNIVIPATTIFVAAIHDHDQARVNVSKGYALTSDHQSLLNYFGRKTEWVMERYVKLHTSGPNDINHSAHNMLVVIGRRPLTRGLYLNDEAFLQSYDYNLDAECNYLNEILKALIDVYETKNKKEAKPLAHMFLIEHFPSSIQDFLACNGHIVESLKKNKFKLAVLHPETLAIEYLLGSSSHQSGLPRENTFPSMEEAVSDFPDPSSLNK